MLTHLSDLHSANSYIISGTRVCCKDANFRTGVRSILYMCNEKFQEFGTFSITWAQARREATGGLEQSGHPTPPPPATFRLWPTRQKGFHSGLTPLRHFEEFLRIGPLQSEAPQSTRPWGNLLPLSPPFLWACLGLGF